MKVAIIFALYLVAVNCAHINMGTWTATTQNVFSNYSEQQLKELMGTIIEPVALSALDMEDYFGAVPTSFDARVQWPTLVHPIRDQQHCGSCWAFGASEAFSDRVAIATNGAVNLVLSPEQLVSCDILNLGCSGGILRLAWSYIAWYGLVSDTCFPYTAGNGTAASCQKTCADGSKWVAYKAKNVKSLSSAAAKLEISTNGPIETAFTVYQDFISYAGGIYQYDGTSAALGGHAIKVVGWGVEDGVEYWIAANSWGTSWGEQGYFRIKAGECGFDNSFITGESVTAAEVSFSDLFLQ